jgi:23S rRNA (pseudouridine1915-N3)-methyltransferase
LGALRCMIVHVGKPRRPFVQSGIEHFKRKIRPYASLSLVESKEEPVRKGAPASGIRAKEAERIQDQMDTHHVWIALDPQGRTLRSEELASFVQESMNRGRSRLAFIIGGPHGLAPQVLARADLTLSLSRMTFSHELTILVLLEQIYRTLAVLHNLPYPK